jgi:hypothetical protein
MAPHVEANSLSDITHLASNPPKYPRNPTEQKRQSLTLYVARVPGTRGESNSHIFSQWLNMCTDIILTTLKPQLKNVTAEDVASSLYYLHLNSEDDVKLLEQDQDAIPEEPESTTATQKPVARKPLPESARSSLDLSRQATATSTTAEVSDRDQKRKPVPAKEITASDPLEPLVHDQQTLPRRPLGPRPLLSETAIDRKPLPEIENKPLNSLPRAQDRTSSPSRTSLEAPRISDPRNVDGRVQAEREYSNIFSITLIRRDPSSGAQWNIGTVSGCPASDEGQDRRVKSTPHSRKAYFDMSIHLTTPGYTYFRNSDLAGQARNCMTGLGNPLPSHKATGEHAGKPEALPASDYGFHRQVRMEGHSFWSRSSIQHKRALSDISDKHSTTRGSISSDVGTTEALPHNSKVGSDPSEAQAKGYLFSSPWGGRCKFSTGSGGRSLRCKHTLPGPASSTTDSLSTPQASAAVSELRFNLPSAAIFASSVVSSAANMRGSDSGRFSIPKFGHIRNKLSSQKIQSPPPLPPRPHPTSYAAMYPSDEENPPPLPPRSHHTSFVNESSDDERPHDRPGLQMFPSNMNPLSEDDEVHLDLSLGQERAGGGNRGKRAKLGKLIIHNEGFKMLDLVVAANIGIWWSVWESDYR